MEFRLGYRSSECLWMCIVALLQGCVFFGNLHVSWFFRSACGLVQLMCETQTFSLVSNSLGTT